MFTVAIQRQTATFIEQDLWRNKTTYEATYIASEMSLLDQSESSLCVEDVVPVLYGEGQNGEWGCVCLFQILI